MPKPGAVAESAPAVIVHINKEIYERPDEALKARIELITHVLELAGQYPDELPAVLRGELIGLQHALNLTGSPSQSEKGNHTIEIPVALLDTAALAVASESGECLNEPVVEKNRAPTENRWSNPARRPSGKDRVLQAYLDGHRGAAVIAEAAGINKTSVHTYLGTLRREGAIPRASKEVKDSKPMPDGEDREASPPLGKPQPTS